MVIKTNFWGSDVFRDAMHDFVAWFDIVNHFD
jgi:hypothetical protein